MTVGAVRLELFTNEMLQFTDRHGKMGSQQLVDVTVHAHSKSATIMCLVYVMAQHTTMMSEVRVSSTPLQREQLVRDLAAVAKHPTSIPHPLPAMP